MMANSVAVIDNDYRGEVKVLVNDYGDRCSYDIGDRVAQAVILPIPEVEYEEVEALSETKRGSGGLGSTGVRENK